MSGGNGNVNPIQCHVAQHHPSLYFWCEQQAIGVSTSLIGMPSFVAWCCLQVLISEFDSKVRRYR